ncbi:hypothetical protein [Persephonella sp.]
MKVRLKKNSFSGRNLKLALTSIIGNFLNLQTFFILIAFAVAVSWIPDGLGSLLNMWFGSENLPYLQIGIGLFILAVLFFVGSYFLKKNYPKIEIYSEEAPKKENLIIFLSPSNEVSNVRSFEDFKKVKTPWQMPAVAVKHHLPKLKNLYVILSNKSKNNFEDFKEFLNRLFPNSDINIYPIGYDKDITFENMEDLKDIIEEVYETIRKKDKRKERETIIDITGGQKLVSIVGAVQTLIEGRTFQYVSTTDYSVKSFDLRYHGEHND